MTRDFRGLNDTFTSPRFNLALLAIAMPQHNVIMLHEVMITQGTPASLAKDDKRSARFP